MLLQDGRIICVIKYRNYFQYKIIDFLFCCSTLGPCIQVVENFVCKNKAIVLTKTTEILPFILNQQHNEQWSNSSTSKETSWIYSVLQQQRKSSHQKGILPYVNSKHMYQVKTIRFPLLYTKTKRELKYRGFQSGTGMQHGEQAVSEVWSSVSGQQLYENPKSIEHAPTIWLKHQYFTF